jgi:hypothetical protein
MGDKKKWYWYLLIIPALLAVSRWLFSGGLTNALGRRHAPKRVTPEETAADVRHRERAKAIDDKRKLLREERERNHDAEIERWKKKYPDFRR